MKVPHFHCEDWEDVKQESGSALLETSYLGYAYIHNYEIKQEALERNYCWTGGSKWFSEVKSNVEAYIAQLNESQADVNFTPEDPVYFDSLRSNEEFLENVTESL